MITEGWLVGHVLASGQRDWLDLAVALLASVAGGGLVVTWTARRGQHGAPTRSQEEEQ